MHDFKSIGNSNFIHVVYPALVVVVAAKYGDKTSAMPAAWNTPLSIDPPLIGVSISPERYTYKLILRSKAFTVNVLPYSMVEKTSKLGDVSGRFLADKLEAIGLTPIRTEEVDSIGIGEALGFLECKLETVVQVGDHDLVVGRVLKVKVREEYFDSRRLAWNSKLYRPILYLGRSRRPDKVFRIYTTTSGEISEIEYAPRNLEDKVVKRRNMMIEVREGLARLREEIARKYNVEVEDVDYIIETVRREEK